MVFTTVNPPFSGGMVTRTTPGRTPAGRLPLPSKVRLPADFFLLLGPIPVGRAVLCPPSARTE